MSMENPHAPKPLIGVTPAFYHHEELDRSIIAVNYTDRIQEAGGLPVIIPPLQNCEQVRVLLDRLDGIVLGGGRDVLPSRYGGKLIPEIIRVQLPQRDRSDFLLVEAIWERRFPCLGICLGLQELNIFLGGDVFQHIPKEVPEAIIHKIDDMFEARHDVRVQPESLLARVTGYSSINTNSAHHQSIKTLANGIHIVAKTEDGIIEAVEPDDNRPFLAVQWHPEMEADPVAGLNLFRWLVNEANRENRK